MRGVPYIWQVQLRHYDARIDQIQRAMHRFWDLIEHFDAPGLVPIRPSAVEREAGTTMGAERCIPHT